MRHPLPLVALAALTACAGAPPRYYKGNLHTHTLWSDGNHFPEMVVDWYAQHDYDFLALTDHNVLADHEKWMQNDQVVRRGGRAALSDYRARFGADWVEERQRDGKLEVRLKRLDEIAPLFADLLLIPAEEVTSSFESRPIHINASNVAAKLARSAARACRTSSARRCAPSWSTPPPTIAGCSRTSTTPTSAGGQRGRPRAGHRGTLLRSTTATPASTTAATQTGPARSASGTSQTRRGVAS